MQKNIATVAGTEPGFRPHSAIRVVRPRRRTFTLAETIILGLSVACLLAVAFSPVFDRGDVGWSGTTTIKVQRAETLWSIASKHPIEGLSTAQTSASIREANHLDRSDLSVGQTLKVPSPSGAITAMASR